MFSIACPYCSRVGKLEVAPPVGVKVRCPGCKRLYAIAPSAVGPATGGGVLGAGPSSGPGPALKRVLNRPESITFDRLAEVCARRSARVFAKVRLADVLPIEGSGLPDNLYRFALQAHYDFVVADSEQRPLFAVEFDGPQHGEPEQAGRDSIKDELSRRFGLPLFRARADDLHRSEARLDRLTEVAERWFDGAARPADDRVEGAGRSTGERSSVVGHGSGRRSCPSCGSRMVVRPGKYGAFLGCSRFPSCRGSCDLLAPSRGHAEGGQTPLVVPRPRPWLVAGLFLVGLAIGSLIIFLSMRGSRQVGPRKPTPARSSTPVVRGNDPATARQMNLLGLLVERRGWNAARRDSEMVRVLGYDRSYLELNKAEASRLVTAWDDRGK